MPDDQAGARTAYRAGGTRAWTRRISRVWGSVVEKLGRHKYQAQGHRLLSHADARGFRPLLEPALVETAAPVPGGGDTITLGSHRFKLIAVVANANGKVR